MIRSLVNRIFQPRSSGAAAFEVPFFYADNARVAEGVFFNQYGTRTVDTEGGAHPVVSWNWAAPTKMDINTIQVNGCTTVSLASSHLPLDGVRALRDECYKALSLISAGIDPDTGV